jgi:hypothetical protein
MSSLSAHCRAAQRTRRTARRLRRSCGQERRRSFNYGSPVSPVGGLNNIDEQKWLHIPAASRIRRLGFIDDEMLPVLFRQSRAVAYPSRGEGFGLPVLEALACGASVVTSANTVMADVAGNTAILVDARRRHGRWRTSCREPLPAVTPIAPRTPSARERARNCSRGTFRWPDTSRRTNSLGGAARSCARSSPEPVVSSGATSASI